MYTFVLLFTKRVITGRGSKVITATKKIEAESELHYSITLTQNTGCE